LPSITNHRAHSQNQPPPPLEFPISPSPMNQYPMSPYFKDNLTRHRVPSPPRQQPYFPPQSLHQRTSNSQNRYQREVNDRVPPHLAQVSHRGQQESETGRTLSRNACRPSSIFPDPTTLQPPIFVPVLKPSSALTRVGFCSLLRSSYNLLWQAVVIVIVKVMRLMPSQNELVAGLHQFWPHWQ